MTSAQSKNLVIVTSGVLVAGTLLKHHYQGASTKTPGGTLPATVGKNVYGLGKPLVAIGILTVVMSIMADQIPDLTGPLALLILVSYISTHLDVFNEFANRGQ